MAGKLAADAPPDRPGWTAAWSEKHQVRAGEHSTPIVRGMQHAWRWWVLARHTVYHTHSDEQRDHGERG